jgi:hypothetical protein
MLMPDPCCSITHATCEWLASVAPVAQGCRAAIVGSSPTPPRCSATTATVYTLLQKQTSVEGTPLPSQVRQHRPSELCATQQATLLCAGGACTTLRIVNGCKSSVAQHFVAVQRVVAQVGQQLHNSKQHSAVHSGLVLLLLAPWSKSDFGALILELLTAGQQYSKERSAG